MSTMCRIESLIWSSTTLQIQYVFWIHVYFHFFNVQFFVKLLSNHEWLNQHAVVLALCEQLGISYLDSCHWLYLAELEKYKVELKALLAFEEIKACIKLALKLVTARPIAHATT